MRFPLATLNPKFVIFAILILVGVPVTVFLVGQNQNLTQKANESPYPKCPPDPPDSKWPECIYGQPTHNKDACRAHAEQYKGVDGPHGQGDAAWFTWAQDPPKPLSCGTACGLAPSFCIVNNTPTPQPSNTPAPSDTPTPKPSKTPTPKPSNTPKPSETPVPSVTPLPTATPIPTATDIPPTPTDAISSCPVPRTPASGLNIRIECPYCAE